MSPPSPRRKRLRLVVAGLGFIGTWATLSMLVESPELGSWQSWILVGCGQFTAAVASAFAIWLLFVRRRASTTMDAGPRDGSSIE